MNFRGLFSITFLFITPLSSGVPGYGENHCVNIKRVIYLEVPGFGFFCSFF